MYEMKDEYLTGIESIDAEHRRLFELAEEAYQLSINEFIPDKYDQLSDILDELKSYAFTHFENEEQYMKEHNYKGILSQLAAHNEFREKISDLTLDRNDENTEETVKEVLAFITDWLVNHIYYSDKKIAE
ncbi:MAG: hemerythrin family protein [Lachnospiraceae bacterium]|nr:hemerythrin family protein [Lachnospiraceae bacterium]